MEIEIESKRNNPLLNRTEVYFVVKHPGEGTPNRELIKSELADKLNVKRENIIVNTIRSGFGIQEISGYAKVYSSVQKTNNMEQDYILSRNKLTEGKKKTKKDEAPASTGESTSIPPGEEKQEEPEKPVIEESKEEIPEPASEPEPPVEDKSENQKEKTTVEQTSVSEPPVEEPKKEEKPGESKEPENTKEEKKEE